LKIVDYGIIKRVSKIKVKVIIVSFLTLLLDNTFEHNISSFFSFP